MGGRREAEGVQLVLLGPPGAGKGTQAEMLSQFYGIPQISTGNILRAAVQAGSELGRQAQKYMNAGQLVPDEVIIGVVQERLAEPDCAAGFLLDGFPRTVPQAEALDRVLAEMERPLTAAVEVAVDPEEVVERLSLRRTCPQCAAVYHLKNKPPHQPGVCDACGAALVQREDDREEVIRKRLEVYAQQTAPLVDYYARKKLLLRVDGGQEIGAVQAEIRRKLEAVVNKA